MRARMMLVFVILAAVSLSAQTFRGTILGTVTDPTGAVLPGAKVTVKNTGTGLERSTETSADGSYSLPELPIGSYNVTVTQSGFQTFVATGVTVDVAAERRIDAALKTGEVSTKVEVSADQLPMVETTTNTLGGVLTAQTVENMPVNGRDYTKLIYMNPGVSGSPDQISDSPGSFGEFSMNGARGSKPEAVAMAQHSANRRKMDCSPFGTARMSPMLARIRQVMPASVLSWTNFSHMSCRIASLARTSIPGTCNSASRASTRSLNEPSISPKTIV